MMSAGVVKPSPNGNGARTFDPAQWQADADRLIGALPDILRKSVSDALSQAMRAHVAGNKPRDRFQLHGAAEALQPQPPITWILDRLFSAGSVSLVVGEAKSKKTYSTLDCGVAVALGEKWLDYDTIQGAVLIIDEESGVSRMNRRLGDTLRGHSAGPDTPIHYVSLAGVNLLESADQLVIEDLIRQTGARLVIIDALIDVLGGADENAASEVQTAFHGLRTIADNTQAAIVVIHHNGKSGSYRGSSAMKGAVDLLLTVTSQPNSPSIAFNVEAPRDTEPFAFAAAANFGIDTFNLSPTTASATMPHFTKGEAYVLRYLAAHGGQATLSDIADHADTISDKTAMNAARGLVVKGYTHRIDAGGRGDRAVYGLTDKGCELNE